MKFKISLLAGLAAFGFASSANAQTVINITGATAFRAAAHTAILSLLSDGGNTQVKYCYVGAPGTFNSSDKIIAEGTIGGQAYIIRTSQNGSTQGIASVATQTPPPSPYLDVALTAADRLVSPGGNLAADTGKVVTTPTVGRFAFSDVDQAISNNPSPVLPGAPVGVVPFVFIANVGAPAGLTNMTDQLHEAQWATGQLPLSMYTGNPLDTRLVLSTGRNNGSGTRATILAETAYGPFRSVVQWGGPNPATGQQPINTSGGEGGGAVSWLQNMFPLAVGGSGYSSNRGVRALLARTSAAVTVNTDANGGGGTANQNVVIVSYLTLSDASAITTITNPNVTVGAKALTYNGVPYTEENVKNGSYTLWGYQNFYGSADITQAEQNFFNAFVAAIPNTLNPLVTGIKIPDMKVTRFGGDGGPVTPNN